MYFFSWFDNQTLVACEILLAMPFMVVFFALQRTHPNLRGIHAVALGFLFGVAGSALIASQGSGSYFLTEIAGNVLFLGSFVFLYRGMLRFIGTRRNSPVPWIACAVSLIVLFCYSGNRGNVIPPIVADSFAAGLVRAFIAIELVRRSPTFTSPAAMRGFAGAMGIFAVIGTLRGIQTLLHGVPSTAFEADILQTSNLFFNLVSVCLTALFFLALACLEVMHRSKDASDLDELSGAFNRRGIEARLALQLKKLAAGNGKLAVAMVEIDNFKSFVESHGQAAGDAALRALARAIANCSRAHDIAGRYDGDQFLTIFPHTPCGEAILFTERLTVAVAGLPRPARLEPLSLSIGVSQATRRDNPDTLIARAAKALDQAKSSGGGCHRVVIEGEIFPGHQNPVLTAAADRVPMTAIDQHMLS
jgi:diguanylate cyclase (GGDEF)-like protein